MTELEVLEIASLNPDLGIKVAASGYISKDGKRISLAEASTICSGAKRRSAWTWQTLNSNTQEFFIELCELVMTESRDASLVVPARIGKNSGIQLKMSQLPLLTNCKKAGLCRTFADGDRKSQKWVEISPYGRDIYESVTGGR